MLECKQICIQCSSKTFEGSYRLLRFIMHRTCIESIRLHGWTELNTLPNPASRMTFTHGRPLPPPPLPPRLMGIFCLDYIPSLLFLFANPPIWLVTPIPFQFLPIEPVIPCRSSNLLRGEIALLGEIYAYSLFEARHTKKVCLIFIREAILWINFKKNDPSCSKLIQRELYRESNNANLVFRRELKEQGLDSRPLFSL